MIRLVLIAAALVLAGEAQAQEQPPKPDFAVEASFDELMARRFAETCAGLEFDARAFDRHMKALLGKYSDLSASGGGGVRDFAPIGENAYKPYLAAFEEKHGLVRGATAEDVCAAGQAEAEERSAMGQMLRVTGDQ